ncbi:MAG TPA: type II toxin-antitoxin system PemK/MazF family toxin [Kineosporiaceae bacterium]
MKLQRGHVIWFEIPGLAGAGRKPGLVVSNNRRNGALGTALVARITTTAKASLPSIVELDAATDPLVGRVLCDDLIEVYEDEALGEAGAVCRKTMTAVEDGLMHALGITPR